MAFLEAKKALEERQKSQFPGPPAKNAMPIDSLLEVANLLSKTMASGCKVDQIEEAIKMYLNDVSEPVDEKDSAANNVPVLPNLPKKEQLEEMCALGRKLNLDFIQEEMDRTQRGCLYESSGDQQQGKQKDGLELFREEDGLEPSFKFESYTCNIVTANYHAIYKQLMQHQRRQIDEMMSLLKARSTAAQVPAEHPASAANDGRTLIAKPTPTL